MTAQAAPALLVVDEQPRRLQALRVALRGAAGALHAAPGLGPALALPLPGGHDLGLVVLGLPLAGLGACEVAGRIRQSAHGQVPLLFVGVDPRAVRVDGVADALEDPADVPTLLRRARLLLELGQLRQALEATRRERDLARRARDDFVSTVVHELRTPLSVLAMEGRVRQHHLDAGNAPFFGADNLRRMLARDQRQVRSLARLVDDMAQVSRLREGRLEIRCAPCDLVALVRRVVEDTAGAPGEPSVRLRTPRGALQGQWDEARLEQVLANLLSNALRHGAGQPVDVSLEGAPEACVIRVRDRGPGIAADDLARVFERFARVGEGARARGIGLGLFIARAMVEAHGGRIEVQSTPGEGATFIVTLPRCAP